MDSKNAAAEMPIAVLIDADNLSASRAAEIFEMASRLGKPIVRRAYGMVNCFASADGWTKTQREFGIVACPQVSNVSHKNVADIALVIDAMELLYKGACQGICLVSSDSDFTALAAKIREEGKFAFGIGGNKTPESFRVACTRFFELGDLNQDKKEKKEDVSKGIFCPRCGGKLIQSRTKSNQTCRFCPTCGGAVMKLQVLKKTFDEESLKQILTQAQEHLQAGCLCPDCGTPTSLLRVSSGQQSIEIDVCPKCQAIWYDKNEFETLIPDDGILPQATIATGKAFRRGVVLALEADIHRGQLKPNSLPKLKKLLHNSYHVPEEEITPILQSLQCRKLISFDQKSGKLTFPTT